jgi:hypothetical protein
MEAATKEAGETKTKVIRLNDQEKEEAGHQFRQLHEITPTKSTAGRKEGLNLNTENLKYPTGSLALQADFFQYGCLTNSSLPTTPSTTARHNPSSGSRSILGQLN